MTVPLLLAGYALLLAVAAPRLLRGSTWPERAPRLGIAAWQAVSASFVVTLILAGLTLAVPAGLLAGGLADLLRSCVMSITAAYRTPAGAAAVGTGLVLAAGVSARVGWCAGRTVLTAGRRRRQHAAALRLVGRPLPRLGATVLDGNTAVAYCLPGRAPQVVLSTAALAALTGEELSAVLAHERAHLAGRHHLILAAADALASAFPRVPLLTSARTEIARLVEMLADDAATTGHGRTSVAAALVRLAAAPERAAALSAGGPTALRRVRRLLTPPAPLGAPRTLIGFALVAVVLTAPAAAAATPAAAVAGMTYCPAPTSGTSAHQK